MDHMLRRHLAWSRRLFLIVVAGAVLVQTHTLRAATFTIPAGDVAALISAINMANDNFETDALILAAGVYTLTEADNDTEGPNGLPSFAITSFKELGLITPLSCAMKNAAFRTSWRPPAS